MRKNRKIQRKKEKKRETKSEKFFEKYIKTLEQFCKIDDKQLNQKLLQFKFQL